MSSRFIQLTLRTSDVEAARAFYRAVLGDVGIEVVQLHEQAVARGARPHWLGFLSVPDVDAAMAVFTARGATALSPKWVNPSGLEAMTLRDPGGAVLGFGKRDDAAAYVVRPDVVWYDLNTNDVEAAKRNYGELFGFAFGESFEAGRAGVFHPFAWSAGRENVGSMRDIAAHEGVHAHWLFHFRIEDFEVARDAVLGAGGEVFETFLVAHGRRLAMCHDPQGAAFVIREG